LINNLFAIVFYVFFVCILIIFIFFVDTFNDSCFKKYAYLKIKKPDYIDNQVFLWSKFVNKMII